MEDLIGSLGPVVVGLVVALGYAAKRQQEKRWSRPDDRRLRQHQLTAVVDRGVVVFVDATGTAPALQARVLDGELIVEAPGTQVLVRLESFWARRTTKQNSEAVNLGNGFAAGTPLALALRLGRHPDVRLPLRQVLDSGGRVAVDAGAFVCVFDLAAVPRGPVEQAVRFAFDHARPVVLALERAAEELQRREPAAAAAASTSAAGSSFAVPGLDGKP